MNKEGIVTIHVFPSRDKWLEARGNHIGGSDASACLGLNPYKNNVQLWEEKIGLAEPEDISEKEYVRYGTQAEEHLRALFALDFPEYEVEYLENNMFLNSKYPWMHASLDGWLTDSQGRRGILEIKTSNILQGSQWEKWNGQVPINYYCQILHYLAVTDYKFAALKAQLKSWRGDELHIETRCYFWEREELEDDIKTLLDAERKFWERVESGQRPALILPSI